MQELPHPQISVAVRAIKAAQPLVNSAVMENNHPNRAWIWMRERRGGRCQTAAVFNSWNNGHLFFFHALQFLGRAGFQSNRGELMRVTLSALACVNLSSWKVSLLTWLTTSVPSCLRDALGEGTGRVYFQNGQCLHFTACTICRWLVFVFLLTQQRSGTLACRVETQLVWLEQTDMQHCHKSRTTASSPKGQLEGGWRYWWWMNNTVKLLDYLVFLSSNKRVHRCFAFCFFAALFLWIQIRKWPNHLGVTHHTSVNNMPPICTSGWDMPGVTGRLLSWMKKKQKTNAIKRLWDLNITMKKWTIINIFMAGTIKTKVIERLVIHIEFGRSGNFFLFYFPWQTFGSNSKNLPVSLAGEQKSRLGPLLMRVRPLTLRNDINRNKNLSSLVFDFEALCNTLYMTPSSKSQMSSDSMCESRNNIKKLQSLNLSSAKIVISMSWRKHWSEVNVRQSQTTECQNWCFSLMTPFLPTNKQSVKQDGTSGPCS